MSRKRYRDVANASSSSHDDVSPKPIIASTAVSERRALAEMPRSNRLQVVPRPRRRCSTDASRTVSRSTSTNADELALAARLSTWSTIALQTSPCAGSAGVVGSPRMPITVRTVGADRWRCARRVSPSACRGRECRRREVSIDVGQIHRRQELLDQLLAELALHERVGGDHARRSRPACRSVAGQRRSKNRSVNGTPSEYLQVAGRVARRGRPRSAPRPWA